MSRAVDPGQLAQLVDLARVKEMSGMAELSAIAAEMARLDQQISSLNAQGFSATTLEEAALVENWQLWRKEQLGRLNILKSRQIAIQREAARRVGKLSAEKAVLEDLLRRAKKEAAAVKLRRASYTS